jgi:hypothetical protein
MSAPLSRGIHNVVQKWANRGYIIPDVAEAIEADLFGVALEIDSQETATLESKVDRVRAIHGDPDFDYRCRECRQKWPCNTYVALESVQS